jgi:hypothetical protein
VLGFGRCYDRVLGKYNETTTVAAQKCKIQSVFLLTKWQGLAETRALLAFWGLTNWQKKYFAMSENVRIFASSFKMDGQRGQLPEGL